jgi:hypothetical protein
MTQPLAGPEFSKAADQLDVLCQKVGLSAVGSLPAFEQGSAPVSAVLWSSAYAHLLLWPLGGTSREAIDKGATQAEGWFDELLSGAEAGQAGRPVDGYLVLALPMAPADDAKDEIRRLELSARICRKHLIWPAAGQNGQPPLEPWCRVADVTVLGLPDAAMAGTSELVWPKIDGEADAVWADLALLGVGATVQKDEAA